MEEDFFEKNQEYSEEEFLEEIKNIISNFSLIFDPYLTLLKELEAAYD